MLDTFTPHGPRAVNHENDVDAELRWGLHRGVEVPARTTTSYEVRRITDCSTTVLDDIVFDTEPKSIVAEFWRKFNLCVLFLVEML